MLYVIFALTLILATAFFTFALRRSDRANTELIEDVPGPPKRRVATPDEQVAAYKAAVMLRAMYGPRNDFDFPEAPASSRLYSQADNKEWRQRLDRVLTRTQTWEWEGIPLNGKCVAEFSVQFGNWLNTPQGQFAQYIARKEGV